MIFKLARKTLGCLFSVLFIGLLIVSGAVWATLRFLPVYIEDAVEDRTGFSADFDNLRVKLFRAAVEMPDAIIENPLEFNERTFIDLAYLNIEFQPASLFGDPLVIDEFDLEIRRIGYVTAPDGRNNAQVFFQTLQSGERDGAEDGEKKESEEEPRMILIKEFSLKIDSITVVDFSRSTPRVREYATDVEMELENVTDATEVLQPLSEEMRRLGLSFVFNGFLEGMLAIDNYRDIANSLLPDTVNSLEGRAKTVVEGAEKTGKVIKNVFETLNED